LQLVSRKDRIFKLSNAEKVVPTEIENLIAKDCAFLAHAFVTGNGRDYPVALLFPNAAMFDNMPPASKLKAGCQRPGSLNELSICLQKCLVDLNGSINRKFSRPQMAMLVDHELSIENEELTPSMKLAPNVVGRVFKAQIEALYGNSPKSDQKVFVINLE
jgi:long-chain acyl-CoA synthetase